MNKNSGITPPDENGVRYYRGVKNTEAENLKKKNGIIKPLIIIGAILLALIIVGVSCNSMVGNFSKNIGVTKGDSNSGTETQSISQDNVAIIHIEGTISDSSSSSLTNTGGYDHQFTLDSIEGAMNNSHNKGLILFVDSPGGGVYESDEIYTKIKEYKEKTGRPVYSSMGSMAASGGYYISVPCDKIIANRNCWTGSIGVTIGTIYDVSGLLKKYGIKTVTIDSGDNKAMGSSVKSMTKEQKKIFQSLVDESYNQFVSIVATGRGLSVATVKKIGDGRIYSAKQALANHLIDKIGTLEDVEEDMKVDYNLGGCKFVDIEAPESSFLNSILSQVSNAKKGNSDVQGLLELMDQQGEMPITYMCEWGN